MMKNRIKAFKNAFNGLVCFFKETYHSRVHAVAATLVIVLGVYAHLNSMEWIAVLLCMALVFSIEALNSSLEYLVDLVSPEYHELAKKTKDVAAAAVLIAAFFSILVAGIVFIPKLISL